MRQVQMAVFDLAGTTIADDGGLVAKALKQAADEHGLLTTLDELNGMMGRSKLEVYEVLASRQFPASEIGDRASAALATYQGHMLKAYEHDCRPIPGAEATFRFLQERGVKVVVDTGFGRQITDAILRHLDWLGRLVDLSVCVDDVPQGRPAPYMIFRAMMEFGIHDVRRVIKVGDNPSDMQEGTNAGCLGVIGVLSGVGDAVTLGRTAHTHILPSVDALPELMIREGWVCR